MELLAWGALVTIVCIIYTVLTYGTFNAALERCEHAYKLAVHSQEEVTMRMNEERKMYVDHVTTISNWAQRLSSCNEEMSRRISTSAAREISEVQRYMETVRKDLSVAVADAVRQNVPPRINPTTMPRRPVPKPNTGKEVSS